MPVHVGLMHHSVKVYQCCSLETRCLNVHHRCLLTVTAHGPQTLFGPRHGLYPDILNRCYCCCRCCGFCFCCGFCRCLSLWLLLYFFVCCYWFRCGCCYFYHVCCCCKSRYGTTLATLIANKSEVMTSRCVLDLLNDNPGASSNP